MVILQGQTYNITKVMSGQTAIECASCLATYYNSVKSAPWYHHTSPSTGKKLAEVVYLNNFLLHKRLSEVDID